MEISLTWILFLAGCTETQPPSAQTWHEKFSWNAAQYFDDPKVVSLCHAIEASDLQNIERQVTAGADVNAKGKGNITPLLWAFPDNKLDRFNLLLRHGADPNVAVESDFETHGRITPGDSVTILAAGTSFPGYFEAVFDHGGDPNLVCKSKFRFKETPLLILIAGSASDKTEKVKLLIKKGANLNYQDTIGETPAMCAAGHGHFDIALLLLEAGADPHLYQSNQMMKLTHVLVRQEKRLATCTEREKIEYQKLVDWLGNHGEPISAAKEDEQRWESWGGYGFEKKAKLMEEEKNARLAREGTEKGSELYMK